MANKALLVTGAEIEQVKVTTARSIHDLIGNWFTTCFNVPSPDRPDVFLTGFCDDEFLLRKHPEEHFTVVLEFGTLYAEPYPIGGPIVITATSRYNGETVSLLHAEMERFFIDERMGIWTPQRTIPTLRFRPHVHAPHDHD